jgi:hypothetical protein
MLVGMRLECLKDIYLGHLQRLVWAQIGQLLLLVVLKDMVTLILVVVHVIINFALTRMWKVILIQKKIGAVILDDGMQVLKLSSLFPVCRWNAFFIYIRIYANRIFLLACIVI